jgi:hypothetical protein
MLHSAGANAKSGGGGGVTYKSCTVVGVTNKRGAGSQAWSKMAAFDFIYPKVRKLNEAGDGVNIASAGIFRSFC